MALPGLADPGPSLALVRVEPAQPRLCTRWEGLVAASSEDPAAEHSDRETVQVYSGVETDPAGFVAKIAVSQFAGKVYCSGNLQFSLFDLLILSSAPVPFDIKNYFRMGCLAHWGCSG